MPAITSVSKPKLSSDPSRNNPNVPARIIQPATCFFLGGAASLERTDCELLWLTALMVPAPAVATLPLNPTPVVSVNESPSRYMSDRLRASIDAHLGQTMFITI